MEHLNLLNMDTLKTSNRGLPLSLMKTHYDFRLFLNNIINRNAHIDRIASAKFN